MPHNQVWGQNNVPEDVCVLVPGTCEHGAYMANRVVWDRDGDGAGLAGPCAVPRVLRGRQEVRAGETGAHRQGSEGSEGAALLT